MVTPRLCAPRMTSMGLTLLCSLSLIGCSKSEELPDLYPVTGTVTLDGKPLSGANVSFEPPGGRPSFGTTDEQGMFSLTYGIDMPGAVAGQHTVRITNDALETGPDGVPLPSDNSLPTRYNIDSQLKETVSEGENTFTFELTSKGR